jgi:hypothetical protein
LLEPGPHELVLDDEERRRCFDPEALGEVAVFVVVDPADLEGVVVSPPLQDLGEEALDAARLP